MIYRDYDSTDQKDTPQPEVKKSAVAEGRPSMGGLASSQLFFQI